MAFLDLVNLRLDYVRAYNSARHYDENRYLAKRWQKEWSGVNCSQITPAMVEKFLLTRSVVSAFTANKELRHLRALFNFAKKRRLVKENPTEGIPFLPVEKRIRFVPSTAEIQKVMEAAGPEDRDYLEVIRLTLARCGEVNRMTWDDVNLEQRYVVLYTRKKRGGHLTPRKVPMAQPLWDILARRSEQRDPRKPWVFWHRYKSRRTGEWIEGPYGDRKRMMKTLCQKAEVPYFRFHALRHSGASLTDQAHVPIGSIQRILGHENRTTTEIYLHSIGEAERQAMTVFEQMRTQSSTQQRVVMEGNALIH
jgi:integrase